MGRKLTTTVHVYDGADVIVYGPGDEVADEHMDQITAPDVWEDGGEVADEPKPARRGKAKTEE